MPGAALRAAHVLAEVDFTYPLDGDTSFPDDSPTPRTWTVNGAAAIEGDTVHPYTAFDTVRVQGAEFDYVKVGGVDYAQALLTLDISGPGTP